MILCTRKKIQPSIYGGKSYPIRDRISPLISLLRITSTAIVAAALAMAQDRRTEMRKQVPGEEHLSYHEEISNLCNHSLDLCYSIRV
jgi:hypothetical protein